MIIFIELIQITRKMKMLPTITFNLQPQTASNLTSQYKPESNNHQALPLQVCLLQQILKPLPHPSPTKFIGTYVIDYNREIGHGNFSHVYVALDQRQPNTKLAVKVVNVETLREQKLENLIKSQVQVLLAARHENIIYCKDALWDNNYCYIFTQFCEGGSLEKKIKNAGSVQKTLTDGYSPYQHMIDEQLPNLQEGEMLGLIKDIFQALVYLEKCHIIHRDIKAANIFIKENRGIVADFGFARYVYEPFYDLNIGSLPFMPPEALSANLYCNKTDVWAFGCLLYQIFHGQSPYAKSHDVKELIQKSYTPLRVNNIRTDLSTEMKELILTCLEIEVEKRKRFTEIEKMWFYRNLFENLSPYNNYLHKGNGGRMFDSIRINGKTVERTASEKTNLESIFVQPQNKLAYRFSNGNRPFASRFKQKVHTSYQSKNMNDNDIDNVDQKYQSQNQGTSQKKELLQITNSTKVESPKKYNTLVTDSSERKRIGVDEEEKKNMSEVVKQYKISFKDVLLRIQEVRNYYKLAITLKDRNRRVTDIKNRLFLRAVKEINKIERLIESEEVDFAVYDRNKEKRKTKDGEKQLASSLGISSRKAKLSSIIKDYKTQFQNQLKRRELKAYINFNGQTSKAEFDFSKSEAEQNTTDFSGKEQTGAQKNEYLKHQPITLAQDIEYIVETQLIYHAEDSLQMSYQECQIYRTKIKEILQDIMHLQHGYLSMGSSSEKKNNPALMQPQIGGLSPSEFNSIPSQKSTMEPMDNFTRLRWKQKSNNERTH